MNYTNEDLKNMQAMQRAGVGPHTQAIKQLTPKQKMAIENATHMLKEKPAGEDALPEPVKRDMTPEEIEATDKDFKRRLAEAARNKEQMMKLTARSRNKNRTAKRMVTGSSFSKNLFKK